MSGRRRVSVVFFFNDTATTEIYTLSLHDALPILTPGRVLSLVIIPQAMPAIVPPLISNWMNTVKNSSLAIAIGYSDIVSLFMQTALNQAGYAVEMVGLTMAFYMVISLTISFFLNIYNKRVQLVER